MPPYFICFQYFLITNLYLLIPTVYAQIFNPNAELIMTTETPTNGVNAVIKTYPLTVQTKIRKNVQSNLKRSILFYGCYSLTHYVLFILKNNFFLCLLFLGFFSLKLRLAFSFAIFVFKVLKHYLAIFLIVIRKKQLV